MSRELPSVNPEPYHRLATHLVISLGATAATTVALALLGRALESLEVAEASALLQGFRGASPTEAGSGFRGASPTESIARVVESREVDASSATAGRPEEAKHAKRARPETPDLLPCSFGESLNTAVQREATLANTFSSLSTIPSSCTQSCNGANFRVSCPVYGLVASNSEDGFVRNSSASATAFCAPYGDVTTLTCESSPNVTMTARSVDRFHTETTQKYPQTSSECDSGVPPHYPDRGAVLVAHAEALISCDWATSELGRREITALFLEAAAFWERHDGESQSKAAAARSRANQLQKYKAP